ncbi:MAG: hypothetical protein U0992_15035 [Planctomycetaceae bacterium]
MQATLTWRRVWQPTDSSATSQPVFEREEPRHPWELTDVGHLVTGALIGVSTAVLMQMTAQLQAQLTFVVFASLGGLFGGVAIGLSLRMRRAAGRSMEAENLIGAGMLLSVASVALLSVLFGALIDLNLWLTATVSDVRLLMPLRALQAALPMASCGLAMIIATDERPRMVRGNFPGELSVVLAGCAAGFVLFRWIGADPERAMPWFEVGACVLALLFLQTARQQMQVRRRALIAAAAGIVLAAASFWLSDYRPARAARLLYSTDVFSAYRSGVEKDTLEVLDDGRLTARLSNGQATWTVWKHHGAQLQFRENGVPRHIMSMDLAICPQSSAELLPAVAPLIVHPHPRNVLLTGLGSTATLQACLAFPVESITCTEADRALVRLARRGVAKSGSADVLGDPRVRLLQIDAALGAAARDEAYDVIIVAATQPALFSSASTATTEYYLRLAAKLQPGGVLCQRFQYLDLGAAPLRDMTATLQAVFPQVRLLETAPGEVILLAMRDDGPVIDAQLADRAAAAHVRRVMSQTGWDWSVLLGLAAVDTDAAAEMVAGNSRVNVGADGRCAMGLGREVLRWGAKQAEIQQMLQPRQSRILQWIGDCAQAEDAAKRLADVNEQQKVIAENPEQPWTYRKLLKERLQNRPRTVIVPVSHEGLQRRLHPEDERRKEYLVALGESARQQQPDAESIRRVTEFADPFDPLVSFFAHHEAAALLSRSASPDRRTELAHRLYTVYYGAGTDRSVRNVTAALQLELSAPDAARAPRDRWDQMNSLLDVLRQRWAYRLGRPEQSRFAAADVSESLTAVRDALAEMDAQRAVLGMDAELWRARRQFLELALVRPLKQAQIEQTDRPGPRTAAAPSTAP